MGSPSVCLSDFSPSFFQGSSIGSYDMKWINNFYQCASGSPSTNGSIDLNAQSGSPTPPLSVLYPSLHTVRNSKSGKGGAGTLFCNKASWEKADFPQHIFKDTMSKRSGVMMHVKVSSVEPCNRCKIKDLPRSDGGFLFIMIDDIGYFQS
jgi:hypothetical protein